MDKKKVYIAARFHEKEEVFRISKLLSNLGYEVISSWLSHKSVKPYHENQELSKIYSIEDINLATQSDYFLVLTSDAGTGMYVELGAAILSNIKIGKPIIYVVGDHINRSMFYFHSSVNRINSIKDLLEKFKTSIQNI